MSGAVHLIALARDFAQRRWYNTGHVAIQLSFFNFVFVELSPRLDGGRSFCFFTCAAAVDDRSVICDCSSTSDARTALLPGDRA